jgi:hypothetical protein
MWSNKDCNKEKFLVWANKDPKIDATCVEIEILNDWI